MDDKKLLIKQSTLEGIANAVRTKKGSTRLIPVPELENKILSIFTGVSGWCGGYVAGTPYEKGAIVAYNGNIYLCIKDLDGMQNPTFTEYWEKINENGAIPYEVSTESEMSTLLESGMVGGIFKYIGSTTETYENGTLYILEEEGEEPSIIHFTVNGDDQLAEKGMSFFKWVNSNYSTDSSRCDAMAGIVYWTGEECVVDSEGNAVKGETIIIEGGAYFTSEIEESEKIFKIGNTNYVTENNLSWYEWCKKEEYNTDNFQCASTTSYVYVAEMEGVVTNSEGVEVLGNQIITEGGVYIIKAGATNG